MARHVMLGNGGLTVGLNEHGYVHDFYFPYVGEENLTTSRSQPHHIGVWVDGEFSWLHDDAWVTSIDFESTELIGHCSYSNEALGITIDTTDFVDGSHDILGRNLEVTNRRDTARSVRLFFHQVFEISADGRADTAMFVPDDHYMLDYKGKSRILAYAESSDGRPFDQYAAGNAGIEGKEGTYRDAEDGELSMSTVEHAGVDSTIRCTLEIGAQATDSIRYWLCVADTPRKLLTLHKSMLQGGFATRLHATRQHWHDWLQSGKEQLETARTDEHSLAMALKSMMVIKAHTDKHGGIIASCDSSIYNYGRDYYSYVWPRDGVYALRPLLRLGYVHEVEKFLLFCANIIHEDGYMMHKYQPDSTIGSTWHPLLQDNHSELAFQEDETAILLVILDRYLTKTENIDFVSRLYDRLVSPAAHFMTGYLDESTGLPHASYDLWEEKFVTSTYTTSVVYKGLMSASAIAKRLNNVEDAALWQMQAQSFKQRSETFNNPENNTLIKGYVLKGSDIHVDPIVDVSSVYGAWYYDYITDTQRIDTSIKAIEELLVSHTPIGGSPRYENDAYFRSKPAHKGNPWFVTTLWLGQYYAATGDTNKATKQLQWSYSNALPSGMLPEQVNPTTGAAVGVTPLVWSHAELLNLILDLQGVDSL